MQPGDVVQFNDGQKTHLAFLLGLKGDDAWALFLTSNPYWNPRCRAASEEELSFTGFPIKEDVTTYLASVVRPVLDATPSGNVLPDHRTQNLICEFGPDPLVTTARTVLPYMEKFPPIRTVTPKMPKRTLFGWISALRNSPKMKWPFPPEHERFEEIGYFLSGNGWVLRSELVQLVRGCPDLEHEFFHRRASHSVNCQAHWTRNGDVLKTHRQKLGVGRADVAAIIGLPERDISHFEEGIQCPSYNELLGLCAILPEMPDEFSLPSSVPLLADHISDYLARRNMRISMMRSACRIQQGRIDAISMWCQPPTSDEWKRMSAIVPNLPPWRPYMKEIDELVRRSDCVPTKRELEFVAKSRERLMLLREK